PGWKAGQQPKWLPHIVSSPGRLRLPLRDPALFIQLAGAAEGERFGRNGGGDGAAGGDIGLVAEFGGGYQSRISSEEGVRTDFGFMLFLAVVVAGDGARADVGFRADFGIA